MVFYGARMSEMLVELVWMDLRVSRMVCSGKKSSIWSV